MTSRDPERHVTVKGQSRHRNILWAQYLETAADRCSITNDHQYEMAYGEWNGHVIDNVM